MYCVCKRPGGRGDGFKLFHSDVQYSDGWVQGGGGLTSKIGSELFLVCTGDGQVDRQDQAGVSVSYDFCR